MKPIDLLQKYWVMVLSGVTIISGFVMMRSELSDVQAKHVATEIEITDTRMILQDILITLTKIETKQEDQGFLLEEVRQDVKKIQ